MYIKNPSTRRTFLLLPLLSDLEPQCEERSNKDEQKQTKKNRQWGEADEKNPVHVYKMC